MGVTKCSLSPFSFFPIRKLSGIPSGCWRRKEENRDGKMVEDGKHVTVVVAVVSWLWCLVYFSYVGYMARGIIPLGEFVNVPLPK